MVWYNKTTSDVACQDILAFMRNKYIKRFWVDLIFSNYANNTDATIERDLMKFARIHEYKWNKEETLAMIRAFLINGKPIDLDISARTTDACDDTDVVEMIDVKREESKKAKYSKLRVLQLNPFDRIVLSGPKQFVETYLEWLKNAEDLSKHNVGKQIISLD